MSLSQVAADSASTWQGLASALVVMLGAVAGAIVTARSTLRASTQQNQVAERRLSDDRDAAIDARALADIERLVVARDRAEQQVEVWRARYYEVAERYQLLRMGVIALGKDPDQVSMPRRSAVDESPPPAAPAAS